MLYIRGVAQQVVDKQQLKEVLESAQKILIVSGTEHSLDKVTAMLALGQALETRGKEVALLAEDLNLTLLKNIPESTQISESIEPRSLRISINYGSTPVENINYENREGVFDIYLTPYSATLSKDQIDINYTGLDYDLILCIGASSLKNLGKVTEQYPQAIEETLIVNIDNGEDNTMFGRINLIDPSSETKAQLAYDIIKLLETPLNALIASLLLTGVMEKTKTMRENVSPRLLKFSALLLDKDAQWEKAMQTAADFLAQRPIKQETIRLPESPPETGPVEPPTEAPVVIPEEKAIESVPRVPLAHKIEPETEEDYLAVEPPGTTQASEENSIR
ncbi:hypothetical protein KJ596_02420 [Patescibacteria group bacterium]|nr:hypothetical protein [Patescibacteria group bacterium]MBU1868645.1 hypothetical protein [Patescibacteria group bacterium]